MMKKRKFLIASLLLTGIVLLIAYGCTKEDENQVRKDRSTNVLVYEDEALRKEVSPYFYDNHIYRIELLGANQEREQIVRAALENGVEEEGLMIEEAQKFYFNHSDVMPMGSINDHGIYPGLLKSCYPFNNVRGYTYCCCNT